MDAEDDDLRPLSALQHLAFCPRQCALIHGEQAWAENRLTAEGRILHERADSGEGETRGNLRIARGVRLVSRRLGLSGIADVVEFRRKAAPGGAIVRRPFPVEYKRGKPKAHDADRIQLCAQALCLEEMLGVEVPEGALFYGKPRRREAVAFLPELRRRVEDLAARLHALLHEPALPPPLSGDARCAACSLVEICRPGLAGRSARAWTARAVARQLAETEEPP
ncbi:CRISPR-associated protein Cas4 [Oleispirillum naphthae]|uniref:CRISPR-associated protein Cas4 n=1 Tax=Oleispirillum naphthae TaxID=2838853 RepID=UPI0030825726